MPVPNIHSSNSRCICCGSTNGTLLYNDCDDYITGHTFSLYRCNDCAAVFTDPAPTNLESYYPSEYRQYGKFTMRVIAFLYSQQAKKWTRKMGQSSPHSLLEIGCGPGIMLNEFKKLGWDTVGLERSEEMAIQARETYDIDVKSGDLSQLGTSKKFDLIILYNVLEHLTDPLVTLSECSKRLKPDGLVLITVPDFDSWQRIFGGKNWLHLDVPRHLCHFDKSSISNISRRANLQISGVHASSLVHDFYGWLETTISMMGFGRNIITTWLSGIQKPIFARIFAISVAPIISLLALPLVFLSIIFRKSALLEFSLKLPNNKFF